jgi:uncharacterized membrane protein
MATNEDPSSTLDGNPPEPLVPKKKGTSEDTLESLVRITLAGFGGSVVGRAQQRQQAGMVNTSSSASTSSSTSSNNRRRQRPPMAAAQVNQINILGNQPRTWALSCMIFALILETSRKSSPTTTLLQSVSSMDEDSVKHTAITAVGDYTLGGTAAGLVGALAGWTQKARTTLSANAMQLPASILSSKAGRRPLILWGLGAGMSLGFVAGLFQAGVDVGNIYLKREQEQRRQSEQRDEKTTA